MARTIDAEETVAAALITELGPIIAGERAALANGCHARGISIPHLQAMTLLDAHGPMPMGHLADLLGNSLPTTTGLVSRMEQRGLVERTHDDTDRRVVQVALADAGQAELGDLTALRQQRLARALSHLTPTQQQQLVESIRQLRSAFERTHSEGVPE